MIFKDYYYSKYKVLKVKVKILNNALQRLVASKDRLTNIIGNQKNFSNKYGLGFRKHNQMNFNKKYFRNINFFLF